MTDYNIHLILISNPTVHTQDTPKKLPIQKQQKQHEQTKNLQVEIWHAGLFQPNEKKYEGKNWGYLSCPPSWNRVMQRERAVGAQRINSGQANFSSNKFKLNFNLKHWCHFNKDIES